MKKKQKKAEKIYFPSKRVKKLWDEKIAKNKDALIENIPFKNPLIIAVAANILIILIILLLQGFFPPQVPLLYGLPEGESQLVSSLSLTIPSLISLLVIVLNIFISYLLKEEFFKKVLIITAVGLTIFSATTTIKIALLMIGF
ncbi:hypothetical protein KKH23_03220 [Patescibacteria group bacterium]|nr:hypothetical protein [Patescibacteria group bacterium]MBU0776732.1 hypothetical protein [Patescibacteria group bacterium]MBU0846176.1 hypothetical protein [Patescibacteria group bacterium]MBU0922735.1 hypothetical protein [Patescibacteria group bacterium]MBU1066252.1 hypothetical protein [Patescibacteria group bacterium]